MDEQYLVCFIEAALAGSTDPDKIRRPSIARTLQRSAALRSRIESAKKQIDGQVEFEIEENRAKNVMLKIARGHAAFELSQPCQHEPDSYWCAPLANLKKDDSELFEGVHVQQLIGEIGSRGIQRMLVTEVKLQSEEGKIIKLGILITDWMDVQDRYYRFIAIDDVDGIIIRMVIAEYLACEVRWTN